MKKGEILLEQTKKSSKLHEQWCWKYVVFTCRKENDFERDCVLHLSTQDQHTTKSRMISFLNLTSVPIVTHSHPWWVISSVHQAFSFSPRFFQMIPIQWNEQFKNSQNVVSFLLFHIENTKKFIWLTRSS